jgi:hypothetical protein
VLSATFMYSPPVRHDLVLPTHASALEEPGGENLPFGHALQLLALTPPELAKKVLARQLLHAEPPSTSAKLPGAQGSHPDCPVNRANLPRAQYTHAVELLAPSLALAFPSGQGRHAYSRLSPSASWYVPPAHLEQLAASVAPTPRPTVPRGQGAQAVAPAPLAKKPAAHAVLTTPLHHEPAGHAVQLLKLPATAMYSPLLGHDLALVTHESSAEDPGGEDLPGGQSVQFVDPLLSA